MRGDFVATAVQEAPESSPPGEAPSSLVTQRRSGQAGRASPSVTEPCVFLEARWKRWGALGCYRLRMALSKQILPEGIARPSSREVPRTAVFFCHWPALSQKKYYFCTGKPLITTLPRPDYFLGLWKGFKERSCL